MVDQMRDNNVSDYGMPGPCYKEELEVYGQYSG